METHTNEGPTRAQRGSRTLEETQPRGLTLIDLSSQAIGPMRQRPTRVAAGTYGRCPAAELFLEAIRHESKGPND